MLLFSNSVICPCLFAPSFRPVNFSRANVCNKGAKSISCGFWRIPPGSFPVASIGGRPYAHRDVVVHAAKSWLLSFFDKWRVIAHFVWGWGSFGRSAETERVDFQQTSRVFRARRIQRFWDPDIVAIAEQRHNGRKELSYVMSP
jgi:hypothetical protein